MSGSAGPADIDEDQDLIEDDYDSYDELFTQHFTDEKLSRLDTVEPSPTALDGPPAKSQQRPANTIRRFLARPEPASKVQAASKPTPTVEGVLPWSQRYAPRNLEELAVHKRKVRDVEQWLNEAFGGRSHRGLLVLKGPAGSGKSTTISLLSDKLGFSILEWNSPSTTVYSAKDYMSLAARFDAFLSRGHEFSCLDLDSHGSSETPIHRNGDASKQHIILIEEFPTLSGRSASVLTAFQLSILRYLSINTPAPQDKHGNQPGIPPIVMVVSETNSNSDSFSENLTVHRLLGRRIYNHPSTAIIEFNSIASTFMQKALNLVLKRSACQPFGNRAQTRSIISRISRTGDIRNAIAALEFLCLGSGTQPYWSNHNVENTHADRIHSKNISVSDEALEEISQKGSSIGLYHAVGKIIYNKRDDISGAEHLELPPPPDHLRNYDRPKASQVNVNELLDEIGTDTQTFIDTLHENYVPSCNGSSFTEALEGCIQSFSDSDVLYFDRKGHSRSQAGLGTGSGGLGAGVDLLRQEEISYQVAARGLLFSLPSPVKRQVSSTDHAQRTDSAHKLFFSPTIRLFRQFEETRILMDSCADALLNSSLKSTLRPLSGQGQTTSSMPTHAGDRGAHIHIEGLSPSAVAFLSRNELILHQLPYLSLMLGDVPGSRDLQRIVGFAETRGPGYISQREGEFAFEPSMMESNDPQNQKRDKRVNRPEPETAPVPQGADDQLILSDDDIVDDL
ncbi:Rad17 cell cycle checkpoint protein-domain-containing protein [Aspergillus unguis]